MLRVNEIISLSLFKEFQLIAGEKGLTNELINVVILEHESITNQYDVFHKGDFVLTSLFFAYDRPELLYKAFHALIERKISGIAIKTVFFDTLPKDIIALANAHRIPVFLFKNAFMEELILSANELLKSKLQYVVWEEKITKLLHTKPSFSEVEAVLTAINPGFHSSIFTAYLTARTELGVKGIESYFYQLIYKHYHVSDTCAYAYVKYQAGILIIYTLPNSLLTNMEPLEKTISYLIRSIDMNPEHLYIGIGDTCMTPSLFDDSILQAIYANKVCRLKKQPYLKYSQMGIYQWITPYLDNPALLRQCGQAIQKLQDYDNQYTSALLDTLIIYINNNGDISKTASLIYQHPNTVRYRIKKACSILQIDTVDIEQDTYEMLYILIKLYELEQLSL